MSFYYIFYVHYNKMYELFYNHNNNNEKSQLFSKTSELHKWIDFNLRFFFSYIESANDGCFSPAYKFPSSVIIPKVSTILRQFINSISNFQLKTPFLKQTFSYYFPFKLRVSNDNRKNSFQMKMKLNYIHPIS